MPGPAQPHPLNDLTPALRAAAEQLRRGGMVILVDDEDRENEGDLVLAAEHATADSINFMVRHARGLVCLSLEPARVDELGLPPMASRNQTSRKTAFMVSIEAREGVATGISAADRAHTIRTAIDPARGRADLVTPGHVFPLRAAEGGVLARQGHTEGSVDLARIAGLKPAAVICEIMNEDGTMSRMDQLRQFSARHGIPILTIEEIIQARRTAGESGPAAPFSLLAAAESRLPTPHGEFRVVAYRSPLEHAEHLALITHKTPEIPLVRIHSECLTGDVFGSARCDCGEQLQASLAAVALEGGAVIYLRHHEGRGIGLANKIKAYALQDQGMDTVDANLRLGFADDARDYEAAVDILRQLGWRRLRLLTNNPAKLKRLEAAGFESVERVPLEITPGPDNREYLRAKRDRLGHVLERL
ncbi:MAG: 3,4-dihydroxy-2-butanone-4-phosphate synthase [Bdellovibrionales bacterium]|nr:3,4-dihydroxy-2-butanone-4-phosphate synthase [Bdellovibrionales bacterium]